jgi:hypothetical protein
MVLVTLQMEYEEPYQAAGRLLDLARKMGFQLVQLRLDERGGEPRRLRIGLLAPTDDISWCDCLRHRLKGMPSIRRVISISPAAKRQ